jgi:hypothetical protein
MPVVVDDVLGLMQQLDSLDRVSVKHRWFSDVRYLTRQSMRFVGPIDLGQQSFFLEPEAV